jgi:O-antigen/teichoic acid export membrane protein
VELARGLGVEGRGELAVAMLWPTVIGNIATLGLEESMTYHVARARDKAGALLGSSLVLCTIQSLIFTAATLAVIPLVLREHSSYVIASALIYSLYVPFNMYGVTLNGTLNGLHRYEWFNTVRLAVGVLVLTAQTVLLLTGAMQVEVLVVAFVSCYLATGVVAGWLVSRARPGRLRFDRATIREVFAYGARSHASSTSNFLNQRLDQLVISMILPAKQLGLYVIGVTFTSLVVFVGGSMAYATLPNVAGLAAVEERAVLARRLVSLTLLLSALVSIPIIVLAPLLIRGLFGAEFVPAVEITRILVLAVVVLSTNRALEAVLRAVGRPLDAGISELVALGTTIAGLAVLLPLLGIVGAAIASGLAYLTAGFWMVRRATRALEVRAGLLMTPDRAAIEALVARLRAFRDGRTRAPDRTGTP